MTALTVTSPISARRVQQPTATGATGALESMTAASYVWATDAATGALFTHHGGADFLGGGFGPAAVAARGLSRPGSAEPGLGAERRGYFPLAGRIAQMDQAVDMFRDALRRDLPSRLPGGAPGDITAGVLYLTLRGVPADQAHYAIELRAHGAHDLLRAVQQLEQALMSHGSAI